MNSFCQVVELFNNQVEIFPLGMFQCVLLCGIRIIAPPILKEQGLGKSLCLPASLGLQLGQVFLDYQKQWN